MDDPAPSPPLSDSSMSPPLPGPMPALGSLAGSRPRSGSSSGPRLLHTLRTGSSVLALAVNEATSTIYCGTQDGEIVAWPIGTFADTRRVQAHRLSVLCLQLASDGSVLVSGAADPFINVWCPHSLSRLLEIYSTHDIGDVFSLAYSARSATLFVGAQNASVQWVRLPPGGRGDTDKVGAIDHEPLRSPLHPDERNHRFFDSKAFGYGAATPRRQDDHWAAIPRAAARLEIDPASIRSFAHFGYVYCLLVATGPTVLVDPNEEVLVSGGGDGTIKLWRLSASSSTSSSSGRNGIQHDQPHSDDHPALTIVEIMVLGSDDGESVLALVLDRSFLYAGKLGGSVELWDLDTKQKLRVIKAHHRQDVTTLQIAWGCLWTASSNGSASRYSTVQYLNSTSGTAAASSRYRCLNRWQAHQGKILASAVVSGIHDQLLITGANDNSVAVWSVRDEPTEAAGSEAGAGDDDGGLVASLGEFVSYKTISSRPEYAEDCRRGANFLGRLFKKLGGQVEMLGSSLGSTLHTDSSGSGIAAYNPVVLATFSGKLEPKERRRRILFYGHYDVVPADSADGKWNADPFRMRGLDGYLYGRGVSDNKGPILAALYAVADLAHAHSLDSDVVFLIEGEEESGSRGFRETVQRYRDLVGRVDYILLANSYWLNDEVPCLTYGLRGVLHATVQVASPHSDKHSGVDGSRLLDEPLSDLTRLLSRLKGAGNRVAIPDFYSPILPVTPEEEARYDEIVTAMLNQPPSSTSSPSVPTTPAGLKASLKARWREPNLTIHRYQVSGPDGSLVSSRASADISLRLVPGQGVDQVATSLAAFLEAEFAKLGTANALQVRADNRADAWLGDPANALFRTLEAAVMKAWARRPLFIREGGSIPAIRFLETEFGAPAAHLPCGQASDAAHMHNERLRLLNLHKSRQIFAATFAQL